MNRREFLGAGAAALLLPGMAGRVQAKEAGGAAIVVGQSIDLSGVMQNIGREYFSGAKVAFDQLNQSGGLGGRPLRLVQLDDGGDPARALANARQLIEEARADLLFGFCSDPCVEAVARSDVFRRSDLDLFAPLTGIDHPAASGRVVYLHPGHAEEMRQIMKRLANLSLTRLGIVHTESAAMTAAWNAAQSVARGLAIDAPRNYLLKEGAANATGLIQAVARDSIQALIVIADAFSAGLLLKPLRQQNPALFVCLGSMVDLPTIQQIIGPGAASGMMVARAVPDPANTLIPLVAGFKRVLGRYMDEAPSAMSLEGYVAGQALISVLRRADGSRRLAQVARDRVGALDLGGLKLDLAGVRAIDQIQLAMLTRDGRLI